MASVMETFPIVKRKDEARFGCYRTKYRTKERILAIYDAMQVAMDSGEAYPARWTRRRGIAARRTGGRVWDGDLWVACVSHSKGPQPTPMIDV